MSRNGKKGSHSDNTSDEKGVAETKGVGYVNDYAKHNLYTGKYERGRYRCYELDDNVHWIVRTYHGVEYGSGVFSEMEDETGVFSEEDIAGATICLILEDENFWPVMSFLTPDEAYALGLKLIGRALGNKSEKAVLKSWDGHEEDES